MRGRHTFESERFFEFGSDLADEFIARDAFADRELERLTNCVADRLSNANGRFARSGKIKVTFINRTDLNVRGEIIRIRKHQPGEEFVFIEIPGNQDEFGAKPPRLDAGHGRVNPKLAGFVRSRGDNAPLFAADRNRLASQTGIRRLLNRGEECVGIQMNDGAGKRHDTNNRSKKEGVIEQWNGW